MRLMVIWHNATRVKLERVKFETEVRDHLLDFYNGVENALHGQNIHYSIAHQRPDTEWRRAVTNAIRFAARDFPEYERQPGHLVVTLKFVPN